MNTLHELVEYQIESKVSKVILKKESGNIILFAFDKNQEFSEYTAPFDAFVYVLDGKAKIGW